MTHLEAFNAVEAKLTAMGLVDQWGDPIEGLEGVGIVAKFHGPIWDEIENHLEQGIIDPATYTTAMEMLIEEFNRARFRNQIEKTILGLRDAQAGVA